MKMGKAVFSAVFFLLACLMAAPLAAAMPDEPEVKILDRIADTEKNRQKRLGDAANPFSLTDPDLALIKDRLFYGQILGKGSLDEKQETLIILACLAAIQGLDELSVQVEGALRIGVDPVSIKEAIYQAAPYVGFPKVEAAIARVNKVFAQNDIGLPLAGQGIVDEKSRFAAGLDRQLSLFGEEIKAMHANAPRDEKNLVADMLTAYCFGDFYTRSGLDLKMRELIVFCVINAIGGCEPQAKAHARANMKIGNTRQNLIDSIAIMLPFIGFPRALNAVACINEAGGEKTHVNKPAKNNAKPESGPAK